MIPVYDEPGVTLYHGDCIEVMRSLPDASVHAVVTDPPYGLEFMGKEWDSFESWTSRDGKESRGKGRDPFVSAQVEKYRAGLPFQQWCEVWATESLRILKPGGYMLSFGGSRTWHRLSVAIEDAGFEIRDSIAWLYGSGFPKGVNLDGEFAGWGTGLKPAFEPIVVARKPLGQTVAASMAEHGTGAINIAATRVGEEMTERGRAGRGPLKTASMEGGDLKASRAGEQSADRRYTESGGTNFAPLPGMRGGDPAGRRPTNVLLEKSQADDLDAQTGILTSGLFKGKRTADKFRTAYGEFKGSEQEVETYGDSGGASRFFPTFDLTADDLAWQERMENLTLPTFHYEAKAPGTERPDVDGVQHPTVKPLDLMRWLARLVASPGAVILEPFAGSGTTLEACLIEGFDVIGIEREDSYLPLIMQRIRKPLQQSLFGELA